MVHIGQKIEELVYKLNIPTTEFAYRINKSRSVVYNIFQRETIDTGLLYTISEMLDYNFFNLYFDDGKASNIVQREFLNELESNRKRLAKAMEEINYLKRQLKEINVKKVKKK